MTDCPTCGQRLPVPRDVERRCERCNGIFMVTTDNNRVRRFCSRTCQLDTYSDNRRASNRPSTGDPS